MNKNRKARFDDVTSLLENAKDELLDIQSEEQEAYDSLSEGLQCSSKGETMLEWIDFMDGVAGDIDKVIGKIEGKIK